MFSDCEALFNQSVQLQVVLDQKQLALVVSSSANFFHFWIKTFKSWAVVFVNIALSQEIKTSKELNSIKQKTYERFQAWSTMYSNSQYLSVWLTRQSTNFPGWLRANISVWLKHLCKHWMSRHSQSRLNGCKYLQKRRDSFPIHLNLFTRKTTLAHSSCPVHVIMARDLEIFRIVMGPRAVYICIKCIYFLWNWKRLKNKRV